MLVAVGAPENVRRKRGEAIVSVFRPPGFDDEVLTLDVAQFGHAVPYRQRTRCANRKLSESTRHRCSTAAKPPTRAWAVTCDADRRIPLTLTRRQARGRILPSRLASLRLQNAYGVQALRLCVQICILSRMRFLWDEAKRRANLRKHGLDFVDAEALFSGITLTAEDLRFEYQEQRFVTLGLLGGTVVVIAHLEGPGWIRVISMRKATRREQILFFENV
jgi:uncharacterized DUF497 family protein